MNITRLFVVPFTAVQPPATLQPWFYYLGKLHLVPEHGYTSFGHGCSYLRDLRVLHAAVKFSGLPKI
jgi:hypothetical protein